MPPMLYALISLWACSAPEPEPEPTPPGPPDPEETAAPATTPPEDTAETGLPSEYVYDEPVDDGAPTLPEAVFEAAIVDVWARMRTIDPLLLHDGYEALRLSASDGACPYYDQNYYNLYNQWYWYDYCYATTGADFSGYGISYWYEPYVSGYTEYEDLAYFYGDAVITSVDGTTFQASGYATYQSYGYSWDDYLYTDAYTSGTYRWDHPSAKGTWLSEPLTVELAQSSAFSATYGGQSWALDGSVSWDEGDLIAVDFDGFVLLNAALGSDCPAEPAGSMAVRDQAGNWYDLTFDGAAYGGAPVFPLTCDGCAEVVHDGVVIYTICPDLAPLVTWEQTPW
jgi:hypothetical protein